MQKKFKVLLTQKADQDLEKIFDYIFRDQPLAAGKFLVRLESRIVKLETMPFRCGMVPKILKPKRPFRQLMFEKYRIIFEIIDSKVIVFRVIHGSRLLGGR